MTEPDIFEPPVFYCTDAIHRDIQDRARAEATAAAEQRLRERIAALREYPAWHACIERVLALLDTPPPASPRQGEPVEGLDVAWREAMEALPEGLDDRALSVWWDNRKPSGWWAAASHRFSPMRPIPLIVKGYDSPAEALQALAAALSEPAEAGEPG